MPLTPLDIVNKEFKHRTFRGYDEDEVNEFLDEVVRDFEALIKENDRLRENATGMTERLDQYRKLESTLQNTLVVAQSTAEELKVAARREAELVMREAEEKAADIIRRAEERVRQLEQELIQMKRETDQYRARVKSLLASLMSLVDELEPVPAPQT